MSDERAVQEVLARYVRAVDARNADTVAGRYVERGVEKFSYNRGGVYEQFAVLAGSQGTIGPIESGCYQISLERTVDGWKMIENHTILDLPSAI